MPFKIKHYSIKNYWLINSALRPFNMNAFSSYNTNDPTQDALHSIVKAIEQSNAVVVPRGMGIIETYETLYGLEKHENVGKTSCVHPIWQYVYSE